MSQLPQGIDAFLASAGWGDAAIEPIPGDASFRRYFRLRRGDETAMLMHAPPPDEDPVPFLNVAEWLNANAMRGPAILAADAPRGWVLTEDFGNDRMKEWLDVNPGEENRAYRDAIDALVSLHQRPAGPFDSYTLETYLREASLFPDWFCKHAGLEVDAMGFATAWREALGPVIIRQQPGVTVLRDYHAENIMLLGPQGEYGGEQGLIDFQDALVGHPAYDLVSLLQDARRDVSPELEADMLEHYRNRVDVDQRFDADYAVLGAQRNAKIVGIFTRLCKRDQKPKYLTMIPRVWKAMERDLAHPALEPVARWFDANVPDEVRAKQGAVLG